MTNLAPAGVLPYLLQLNPCGRLECRRADGVMLVRWVEGIIGWLAVLQCNRCGHTYYGVSLHKSFQVWR
jgi:hypothetical protein